MLLTRDVDNTVLQLNLKGKEIVSENEEEVFVKANAGENWHEFVLFTIQNNWGGLENLSLIPGNVGTAPIQNIGAYGVEIKDSFVSCDALDIQTLEMREFSATDCEFGYRNSIFKQKLKGKYIITSVTFRLKKVDHNISTNYGAINDELKAKGINNPTIKDISNAVISIRQQKLPDPKVLGNSGSFFQNPVVPKEHLHKLQQDFPEIPYYEVSESEVKIPAGWLIDKAGFKGYREGDAGVHKYQALVLVNYGSATGKEILDLAKKIQKEIFERYRIYLQPEVNIF